MSEKTNTSSKSTAEIPFFVAIATVLALSALLFFFRLGERPFRNPDEGRYADIAHEMAATGDWVKPTVFGLGYLRKPPMFYWLLSASFKTFGESEWTARAVPAVFGLFGVLIVFFFTRRFFGGFPALYASLIVGTNVLFVQVGRYLVIDAVYTFFLVSALFMFYLAFHAERGSLGRFLLFYVLVGLAFMTKGLATLVVIGLSVGAYLSVTRQWNRFWGLRLMPGLLILGAIVVPWFWMMELREPGFLKFFFLHEHLQRFVSSEFEHQEPWYYYLVLLPLVLFPWSLNFGPMSSSVRRGMSATEKDAALYLFLCSVATVLFYSVSRSKLPTYVLPCLPLLSVYLGVVWHRWSVGRPRLGSWEAMPVVLLMVLAIALMVGAQYFVSVNSHKYPAHAAQDIQWTAGACLVGGVLCLRSIFRQRPGRLFFSWVFLLSGVQWTLPLIMEDMNPMYSTKAFAKELSPRLKAGDEVLIFDHPGPFYDLLFYLQWPVRLVGLEGELMYSKQDKKADEVSITRDQFYAWIREGKHFFVMMRKSDYQEMDAVLRDKMKLLKIDKRKVLLESAPAGDAL